MINNLKKLVSTLMITIIMVILQTALVCAAEINENNNPYMDTALVNSSASTLPDFKVFSIAPRISGTYYQSLKGSYGLMSGCTLNGSNYFLFDTGVQSPAKFSAVTTFYHSDGNRLYTNPKVGSSTSSQNFNWSINDDTDSSGMFYTANTYTNTVATKEGYYSKTLDGNTYNPFH